MHRADCPSKIDEICTDTLRASEMWRKRYMWHCKSRARCKPVKGKRLDSVGLESRRTCRPEESSVWKSTSSSLVVVVTVFWSTNTDIVYTTCGRRKNGRQCHTLHLEWRFFPPSAGPRRSQPIKTAQTMFSGPGSRIHSLQMPGDSCKWALIVDQPHPISTIQCNVTLRAWIDAQNEKNFYDESKHRNEKGLGKRTSSNFNAHGIGRCVTRHHWHHLPRHVSFSLSRT